MTTINEIFAAGFRAKGSPKKLSDTDLPRLGYRIGVGEDEVHAFLDVETRGGGYDKHGRLKMLREPHIQYKLVGGTNKTQLLSAGLIYPKQGTKPYPAESYTNLMKAAKIDVRTTLMSSSWGIGQVLGTNFVAAGFNSVEEMIIAMYDGGEAAQLECAINFIKYNHLDDELRDHRWAAFARGYNGPKYRINAYDTKLAAAFSKWSKIKDTPWSPDMIEHEPKPVVVVKAEELPSVILAPKPDDNGPIPVESPIQESTDLPELTPKEPVPPVKVDKTPIGQKSPVVNGNKEPLRLNFFPALVRLFKSAFFLS